MDKYILVTNANTQIGNEVVKKLISDNYIIFAGDVSYENKKFGNLIYLNLDTTSYKSLESAKRYIQKYTSRIYALINLNNFINYSTLLECSEDMMMESIEKNYLSAFKTNQVMSDMLEIRNGRIIHDCSDVSINELVPFNGVYSLSKTLLKNYNDVLRRELKYKGISVVRIHTGLVKDTTYEQIQEKYHEAAEYSKMFYDEMSRFTNLNLSKENLISVIEYCNFLSKVVNTKVLKRAYFYKCNKNLRFITRLPRWFKDIYFKNYQK